MEQKTKVVAEDGKQELLITREFDLPLDLLFRAHVEPEIIAHWMGTQIVQLESKKHSSYQLAKTDPQGNTVFQASGVIHEFIPEKKITRTFEMENTPFGVQLEIYSFEPLTADTSKLTMHTIYESVTQRDQVIKLGMVKGIGMAHDRIQQVAEKLKN